MNFINITIFIIIGILIYIHRIQPHNNTKPKKIDYYPKSYIYIESILSHLDKIGLRNKRIFAIQGCDKLCGKDSLFDYFRKYLGMNYRKYLPESYLINNESDCKIFLKKFFKKKKKIYFKKNIQNKNGIFLTDDLKIINREIQKKNYCIIQEEVTNIFLLNGFKINLRLYITIFFQNGIQKWYLHPIGKCLYTEKPYNTNIIDYKSDITSLTKNNNPGLPFTTLELQNIIGDKNYSVLFKNIQNLIDVTKMIFMDQLNLPFNKKNTCFQLFGIDILFTNSFYPYLLEINKGPDMKYYCTKDENLKKKILEFHDYL